jgi:hypothetical protein
MLYGRVSATSLERRENRGHPRGVRAKDNEQVEELIEFWLARKEGTRTLKRNKCAGRGAVSEEKGKTRG